MILFDELADIGEAAGGRDGALEIALRFARDIDQGRSQHERDG
jgi:hypothetical protein